MNQERFIGSSTLNSYKFEGKIPGKGSYVVEIVTYSLRLILIKFSSRICNYVGDNLVTRLLKK